ncbi:unnamed protein product [Rotaria sp. Silwood1]|nr:unnamed protein product [Rotaria sp. Silwood1]CAF1477160.1 unnamed protein product [Rotaria sp. Silwood1]CAF3581929.1 unnamed protein product [Rotaria sp. Silwood1]CAF3654721.1 unnamed protein product [Rotaria sp. Silwood1]CAF4789690.1 unnamed protein product [Rotaria sp. Silwood1]
MDRKDSIIAESSIDEEKNEQLSIASKNTAVVTSLPVTYTSKEQHELTTNTTEFVQNFLLIWLNSNNDEVNENNNHNNLMQLRSIVNTVKTFTNMNRCVDFLTDIQDEKAFMILAATVAQYIVPLIHDIPQLNSIYILSENESTVDSWIQKWNKVKGVFTNVSSICEKLNKATQQFDQNAISISFVSTNYDISNRKLNQLDQSFMYTQILKEILLTIHFDDINIKDFANYCRKQCADNDRKLDAIDKMEHEYHRYTPIWWYSHECLLYSMINRALRMMDIDIIIKMGFFLRDLHQHIEQLHVKQCSGHQKPKPIMVYRGQGMSHIDFDQMKKTKGGLISFNNFLSTSKDESLSNAFAESNQCNPDLVGVLFEITIDPAISSTSFAFINDVSQYKTEDEILFSMHTIFRINDITQINNNNRMWRVNLSLTNDNDQDLHTLIDSIREDVQGPTGWDKLGLLLIKLGLFKKAEEVYKILFNHTLNDNEKADFYHMLGAVKHGQGEYEEAMSFYQKSLEINKNILPQNHPNLARSYFNMGGLYDTIGNYPAAFSFYEKASDIYRQTLPSDHPGFANVYSTIGRVHEHKGEYSKAMSYYIKDFEISQNSLPWNHPDLAASYNKIGDIYGKIGQYSKALSFHEKTLEIYRKTLPPNHPQVAACYSCIGSIYSSMGEYSKALSSHETALNIYQKTLPSNHSVLSTVYGNIGYVYSNMGDHSKALLYHKKSLEIIEETLPSNHDELGILYSNIGSEYFKMNEYSKAILYYEKAVELIKKSLPSDHPNLAVLYGNLGSVYDQKGDNSKALLSYEKALEILQKSLPSNHPYIGKSYGNIGHIYENIGDYKKALAFYEKGLNIYEKTLPSNHPHLAAAYSHVASMYFSLGNYLKAVWSYELQFEICQKILPSNHPQLAIVCNNIGLIYGTMGEYSKAFSFHQRAVLIRQHSLFQNDPNIQMYKDNLEFIRRKL